MPAKPRLSSPEDDLAFMRSIVEGGSGGGVPMTLPVCYLADASYGIYILHLPLVMLAQVWVQDWPGAWWLKLLGITVGVSLVCLISYELLIRHSFMGKWLNGRRVPWRKAPPADALTAPAE